MQLEFLVEAGEAGAKLGGFLRRRGVSLAEVRSLKRVAMGLAVNGAHARTCDVLAAGDRVALNLPQEAGFSAAPQALPIDIVFESGDALVANKPAGQVVHPCGGHRSGTFANAFCGLLQARGRSGVFRPVGRLDGGTSGLLLCAMHAAAAPVLAKTMRKGYLALVGGSTPPGGTITAPLAAAPGSGVLQCVSEAGRFAQTAFETLATGRGASLVRVWPSTGRTHQIRVHFAHIGHPLLGDELYGGDCAMMPRHALHCAQLAFGQLCGGPVQLSLPLPEDMRETARAYGIFAPFGNEVNNLFTCGAGG